MMPPRPLGWRDGIRFMRGLSPIGSNPRSLEPPVVPLGILPGEEDAGVDEVSQGEAVRFESLDRRLTVSSVWISMSEKS